MTTDKPKYQWLSTQNLKVDERYQRDINTQLAKSIAKSLDWSLFGALTVFRRGQYDFIVDGRTRYSGAIGANEKKVPCLVYESHGVTHEAEIFRKLGSHRRQISARVNFRAGLLAKDPDCIAVNKLIERFRFRITLSREAKSNGRPDVGCTNTLLKLYRKPNGPTLLAETMQTISKAWDKNAEATRNEIIQGLFVFFEKCAAQQITFDHARLAAVISKHDPAELAKGSKYVSKMMGGSRHAAITDAIVQAYNSSPGVKIRFVGNSPGGDA